MEDLIRWESISQEAAEYLKVLVKAGYNIFISGATSTGKTTFLNVLADYIPKTERVITIEAVSYTHLEQLYALLVWQRCRKQTGIIRRSGTRIGSSIFIRDLRLGCLLYTSRCV